MSFKPTVPMHRKSNLILEATSSYSQESRMVQKNLRLDSRGGRGALCPLSLVAFTVYHGQRPTPPRRVEHNAPEQGTNRPPCAPHPAPAAVGLRQPPTSLRAGIFRSRQLHRTVFHGLHGGTYMGNAPLADTTERTPWAAPFSHEALSQNLPLMVTKSIPTKNYGHWPGTLAQNRLAKG